ncbi:MAG: hypothetical protein LBH43_17305 [Treponema sp.]|jgi:hypothetical protein|nr:hypothetical protein [Treponema sp.]
MTKKRLEKIEILLESGEPFIIDDILMECAEYYVKGSHIDDEIHRRIQKIQSKINKIISKINKLRREVFKYPIGEVPIEMATEYIKLTKHLGLSFPKKYLTALTVPLKPLQKNPSKKVSTTISPPKNRKKK